MKINVIIFDLDDTLYKEINYVYSGFKVVSKYFAKKYDLNADKFYNGMINILNLKGRGSVFDDILHNYNIYKKEHVNKAVSIYRNHMPDIKLSPIVSKLLNYYNELNVPLYVVTDGNKVVQSNKINALQINSYVKKVFITHRYGKKHAKPSTYCFEKIAKLEKTSYKHIVYIGDNINKDFVNIKQIGFKTIRIKQGMFKDDKKPSKYHADIDINHLSDIMNIIKKEFQI